MATSGTASFDLSIEVILGYIFAQIAWLMGIPWNEAQLVGILMGKKILGKEKFWKN